MSPRQAYYPGAEDRWQALTADRAQLRTIGNASDGRLPWTIIRGLEPAVPDEPLYSQAPFCSVVSEARLGSSDPIEFLDRAVEFANTRLWGSLSATLVVHPKSLKDPPVKEAV